MAFKKTELRQEFDRAAKLVDCMAKYIGKMALYDGGYADLNEHFLFVDKLKRAENTAGLYGVETS